MISIPFSIIFGWAERSERREEERNEALEDIAYGVRRGGGYSPRKQRSTGEPIPPKGGSGTVYKDDRAVIIDNRQVNIYNGVKPREN